MNQTLSLLQNLPGHDVRPSFVALSVPHIGIGKTWATRSDLVPEGIFRGLLHQLQWSDVLETAQQDPIPTPSTPF